MALARRRLNSYSWTPRALSAPGEVAVWPTSITSRNVERGQVALSLGVLRRSFLCAHWLPNRGADDRGESGNSDKCKFADDHRPIVPARSSADHEHLAAVCPPNYYLPKKRGQPAA